MLMALALALATLLVAAAPALAQKSADEERVDQEKVNQEAGTAKEGVDEEERAAQEEGVTEREATDEEGAAQVAGPATATGLLGRAAPHSPDPTPVYAITDEATGTPYELVSGFVNLEQYVGERVTIQGVRSLDPATLTSLPY